MNFEKIKLVISDMDGTLLNANHEASDLFFEQHQQLKNLGVDFIAASGRQYASMVAKLKPVSDAMTFVSENGAYVRDSERTLLSTAMHAHEIQQIVNALEEELSNIVICRGEQAFLYGQSTAFLQTAREFYASSSIIENKHAVLEDVLKVAVYHPSGAEEFLYPKLQHLQESLLVKVSGHNWVDISHPNAHKGYAVTKLMAMYDLTPDQIMVFGDYHNDLEMLKLTKNSFAMKNAHPDVKAVAQYETASNEEQGVEQVLAQLIEAKKVRT